MLLRYHVGGHYKAHTDAAKGVIAGRRISVIVQLSDPDDYRGGEVRIIDAEHTIARQRGTATLFPADMLHQVHPVITGRRYALITWIWSRSSAPGTGS